MTYQDFVKIVNFGDLTAFVYHPENSGLQFSSGEVYDDLFDNTTEDTDFTIVNINDIPEVKQVIIDNFLSELAPAKNVYDDNYKKIERRILTGDAKVGYWQNYTKYGADTIETTVYMLIL